MTTADSAGAGKKPWTFKRAAIWGIGGLFAIGAIGAVLDPEAGKPAPAGAPARTAMAQVDEDNVEALQDAMKPIGGQGQIFAFAIPAGAQAIDVEAAAQAQCRDLAFCQVYGWQDARQLPGAWPMLDREVAALSFRYALNRNSSYEDLSWYCGSVGAKPDCTKADAE
jgi:hypothetical protein